MFKDAVFLSADVPDILISNHKNEEGPKDVEIGLYCSFIVFNIFDKCCFTYKCTMYKSL